MTAAGQVNSGALARAVLDRMNTVYVPVTAAELERINSILGEAIRAVDAEDWPEVGRLTGEFENAIRALDGKWGSRARRS